MQCEMRGISKSFGSNLVLDGVDFSVSGGCIKALLGENGAGKSTLMNILGGVLEPNAGQIVIDGNEVHFQNPKESLDRGIAFIHQELNLINDLAIYENLFIGREIQKKNGFLDHEAMVSRTREVFARMGLDLDPRTMVRTLDASYKQIVEISRALLMDAKLVIMDEPTSSLTGPEIGRVFSLMRRLRAQGVGIIFISHKLNEVMEICDDYAVLRDGHMVSTGKVHDVTTADLAACMVGHTVIQGRRGESARGDVVLAAENLGDGRSFSSISFSIRSGEIVGFTGLLGDGRSEIFQTVFGARGPYEGRILVDGREVRMKSTTQAVDLGIGYVPKNRKENGIVKDLSILENGSIVTLSRMKKHCFFLDEDAIRSVFLRLKDELHIKLEHVDAPITSLSGGNQQKVVLAKWLALQPGILILDNPTQGVDVGAKEDIYEIITRLPQAGIAVVVLSSEADEIIRLCSRSYVLYHGRIVGELTGSDLNEQHIMRLATGVTE